MGESIYHLPSPLKFVLLHLLPPLAQGKGGSSGGNMAALELVAMDMKAQGMYVCRTLSFAGGWVSEWVPGRQGWQHSSLLGCGRRHGQACYGWAGQGSAGQC